MDKQYNEDLHKAEMEDYDKFRPTIRPRSALESFKYAVDGILDVFRTQKHMRFHFVTVLVVLLVALMMDLEKSSMLILLFTISIVLVAEMFNTAIEAVVDMITQTYHPLAKFAKDAAAGAVLIATFTAVLVGFLLFLSDTGTGLGELRPADPGFAFKASIVAVILLVLVTLIKFLGSKGKLLRGGIISGHATAGFFLAATILFVSKNALSAVLGIMMALLIAQSRVQAKIHTIQEVITGALVAMIVTALLYWIAPGWWEWVGPWLQRVTQTI